MEIAGVSMRVTDDRLGFERGALEALERHCGAKPDASHAEQVLLEAAAERKLPHEVVTGAMRLLEDASGTLKPEARAGTLGRWRLIYSDIVKIKALRYIPFDEYLTIEDSDFVLDIPFGPLQFKFAYGYEWVDDAAAAKFGLRRSTVRLLGQTVRDSEARDGNKDRVYAFFYVTDRLACLRSSAGGYTLMAR